MLADHNILTIASIPYRVSVHLAECELNVLCGEGDFLDGRGKNARLLRNGRTLRWSGPQGDPSVHV